MPVPGRATGSPVWTVGPAACTETDGAPSAEGVEVSGPVEGVTTMVSCGTGPAVPGVEGVVLKGAVAGAESAVAAL